MIRFKINADRFADACTINDYLGVTIGKLTSQLLVLPKMVVAVGEHKIIKKSTIKGEPDEVLKIVPDGEYIVEVVLNEDGDIKEAKFLDEAQRMIEVAGITPRRLSNLCKELTEASKNIVNPPNGGV